MVQRPRQLEALSRALSRRSSERMVGGRKVIAGGSFCMKKKASEIILLISFIIFGIFSGLVLITLLRHNHVDPELSGIATEEERAQGAWMDGCVPYLMDETQKLTDVVNEEAATGKAALYCACTWNYMRQEMELSLEEMEDITKGDSRDSGATTKAFNYCYEKYRGDYY